MWANVLKSEAPAQAPTVEDVGGADDRIVIVDANAIISGIRLEGLGDRFCTIQEALNEVRDKRSRTFLSTLPYGIQVKEPTEESVKAGGLAGWDAYQVNHLKPA